MRIGSLLVWLVLVGWSMTPVVTHANEVRRLIAFSHAGNEALTRLRYADSDASKMHAELTEHARFAGPLIHTASVAEIEAALAEAQDDLEGEQRYTVLFVYFSGHGTTDALSLGEEYLPRQRLFDLLEPIDADLKIVMLDACRRIASKDGRSAQSLHWAGQIAREPPAGMVVLYPAGLGELAYEDSEYEGALFTHGFLAGIRGAARYRAGGEITLGAVIEYTRNYTDSESHRIEKPQIPVIDSRFLGDKLVLVQQSDPAEQLEVDEHGAIIRDRAGRLYARLQPGQRTSYMRVEEDYQISRSAIAPPPPVHLDLKLEQTAALARNGLEWASAVGLWREVGRLAPTGHLGMRIMPERLTRLPTGERVNENALELNLQPGLRWWAWPNAGWGLGLHAQAGPGLRRHARTRLSTRTDDTWFWTARARTDLRAVLRLGALSMGVQAGIGLVVYPQRGQIWTQAVPAWGINFGWQP